MNEAQKKEAPASTVEPEHGESWVHFFKQMVLPRKWLVHADRIEDRRRYRRLWWYSLLLTLFVSWLPIFVMVGVNYYMFRKNVTAELRYDVSRDLNSISRSLQFVIEERLSALKLIISEKQKNELFDHEGLARTLNNLKETFRGFVDLGVIDRHGDQIVYVGPYTLEGVNYQDQQSFEEAVVRGSFVTDVFMGHRNVPHFAITVRVDEDGNDFHVLRATVDMETLNRLIYLPRTPHSEDIFVVNREGILQTPSQQHGSLLESATIQVPSFSPTPEVLENYPGLDTNSILGFSYIENTPFVLMITQHSRNLLTMWVSAQTELLVFLVISVILIMIVALWSSTRMVRQIRTSMQRRTKMLMNVEYTNKMATIGRLAASVAHEINNPLAIINEKAGLLSDLAEFTPEYPNRDKTMGAAASIIRSVERCSTVTHRLLGFTRKMQTQYVPLDVRLVLAEVMSFLEKEASHRNIRVFMDFDENVPTIDSDRGQLQQVFLNLLNNAFAAVDDSGRINLYATDLNGQMVKISIRDNGKGISKDNLEHIFEPFFSTKGDFGTGLGLSITYGIIQKLGGRIEVQSELDVGTTFTVYLPIKSPSAAEVKYEQSESSGS
jgi:two-component system, NtrC family, sensor kinase